MSGWIYPGCADAPGAGLAVGLGVHSAVQAYAPWEAWPNTNKPISATANTTAPATIATRYRSRSDGCGPYRTRSRRPARWTRTSLTGLDGARSDAVRSDGRVGACPGRDCWLAARWRRRDSLLKIDPR